MRIIVYANFLLIIFVSFSFSQDDKVLSKIQFEKQRMLYKKNNVKVESIYSDKGSETITKYDKNGKPKNSEYNLNICIGSYTEYKYDRYGHLIEESNGGGDGYIIRYNYDKKDNVISSGFKHEFDDEGNPTNYAYDRYGSLILNGVITINNKYKNRNILYSLEECIPNLIFTKIKRFSYDKKNRLILEESFIKNSTNDLIIISSRTTYKYYKNGLKKSTTFESSDTDEIDIYNYKYQYYKK